MQHDTQPRRFSHRRVMSESAAAGRGGYSALGVSESGGSDRGDWSWSTFFPLPPKSHSRAPSFAEPPLPRLEEHGGSGESGPPSSTGDNDNEAPDLSLHRLKAPASQLDDGTRLWHSLAVPRRTAAAAACVLCALALVTPLVFSDAVTGDALWGPFARPGTYLNVEVVRAQGLPLRSGHAGAVPFDTSSPLASDASLVPHPYIVAVTWPWSRSGEFYQTNVPVNATQAPVWQQSFTFDQSNTRARKVALWLKDATGTGGNGVSFIRDSDPPLGLAMVPVPSPGTQAVSVTDRATGEPSPDIVEGWWPIRARASESDYEHADAPAIGEVYARVSFAERRAKSGYCEEVHLKEPVAQPVDSYSNFGFLLSGTHMLAVCFTDAVRLRAGGTRAASLSAMQLFPVYSCANGLTQYFVGAGSFLFHASMTEVGQNLDMSGVYMLLGTPMLYIALRLGFLGPPHRRLTHLTFFVLTTVGSFLLYQYRRELEAPAGGSTNLVLSMIALLIALTGAWLWLVGNAPEERRLSVYDDELDELLAMPPSPSEWGTSAPLQLPDAPPGTHTHSLLRTATTQLRHLGWAVRLAVFPTRERQARSSELALVNAEADTTAAPLPAGFQAASELDASPASPPMASPRYMSRQERLAAALMALKARSKPKGMRYRYCCASVLCIGVAYISRQLDVKYHVACYPTGWFQLHAVWHILAAASLYFLWVFMRCEAPVFPGGASVTATPRATDGHGSGGSETRMQEHPSDDRLLLLGAAAEPSESAAVDAGRAASPRGAGLFTPRTMASATVDLADLRSPRSRAASMLDVAGGAQGSMLSGGRDSSGGDADADAVVGYPAGTARAAAHLRTRSREVVFGHDMV